MKIFMKAFLLIVMLTLIGCSDVSSKQLKFKFNDQKANEILTTKLQEENIEYYIDDEGWIRYSISDKNKIDRLVKVVTKEYFVPETSISYADPAISDIFQKKLEEEGIPFDVRKQDDRVWVVWDKRDNEKVKDIKKDIEDIILQK